jgi:hypothetical protein
VPADSRPVSSESASKQVLGLLPLGIASGAKRKGALRGLAPVEGVVEDRRRRAGTRGRLPPSYLIWF